MRERGKLHTLLVKVWNSMCMADGATCFGCQDLTSKDTVVVKHQAD